MFYLCCVVHLVIFSDQYQKNAKYHTVLGDTSCEPLTNVSPPTKIFQSQNAFVLGTRKKNVGSKSKKLGCLLVFPSFPFWELFWCSGEKGFAREEEKASHHHHHHQHHDHSTCATAQRNTPPLHSTPSFKQTVRYVVQQNDSKHILLNDQER